MDFFTRLPGPLAQPTDSPLVPGLAQWESAIRHGGQTAAAGHTGVALRHTREALRIAQALLEARAAASTASSALDRHIHARDAADQILAALVVSHHNLADIYQAAHLPEQAAAHVCRAHAALMDLLADAAADTALREAAWRHSRETHAELLLFIREKGPHPAVMQALHDHANPASRCGLTRH